MDGGGTSEDKQEVKRAFFFFQAFFDIFSECLKMSESKLKGKVAADI